MVLLALTGYSLANGTMRQIDISQCWARACVHRRIVEAVRVNSAAPQVSGGLDPSGRGSPRRVCDWEKNHKRAPALVEGSRAAKGAVTSIVDHLANRRRGASYSSRDDKGRPRNLLRHGPDVGVNRPIVATPKGVTLGRPSEMVLGLLSRLPARAFVQGGWSAYH